MTQTANALARKKNVKPKTWTVILYMAGDNNLTEDMITALKNLKKFAGKTQVKILALYDSAYPPVPVAFYDFSRNLGSGKPLKVFTKLEDLRKIQNKPASAGGRSDPYYYEEWREFVKLKTYVPWILQQSKYRADNYALILSGHSDGIIGRTILRDDNPPNALNLRKLGGVLKTCCEALPKKKKKKFDILGFDGCLMGMIETAYQFRGHADVMISSEGNIPNSGWDYSSVIKSFYSQGATYTGVPAYPVGSNERIAMSIASGYRLHNRDYVSGGRVVNVSAFKLSETEKFAKKIDEIAGILHYLLELLSRKRALGTPDFVEADYHRKFSELVLLSHLRSQTFMHNQAVDVMDFLFNVIDLNAQAWLQLDPDKLADFLENEKTNNSSSGTQTSPILDELFDEFKKLYKAYKKLVELHRKFVLESCFVGAEYQFSRGVSIFLPWNQMALNLLSTQYRSLEFKAMTNWEAFFRKYVELTMRTPKTKSLLDVLQGSDTSSGAKIQKKFVDLLNKNETTGREYIGKEYIGKEYIGKGDAFYAYFSDFRNYSHVKPVKPPVDPPEYEVDFDGCNNAQTVI